MPQPTPKRVSRLYPQFAKGGEGGYVIPANVHVVMTAFWHADYQACVNQASLVTADGMPLVWGLKALGESSASRVYGPDLMLAVCEQATQEAIAIYLYGGTAACLTRLEANLKQHLPQLNIVGSASPPFRQLSPEEDTAAVEKMRASGAKIIFVGLGCPKQEIWMAQHHDTLSAVMIGVGAAFDFHGGQISQAPRWMMKFGLEWLYRLVQEPQRLWRRYLLNNPAFIVLFGGQLLSRWTPINRGENP